MNSPHPEIEAAVEAVRQAGLLVRQIEKELISQTLTKDDLSPVTVADFASQALVAHFLGEHLGRVTLVGEEDAAMLRRPENLPVLEQVAAFVRREIPGLSSSDVCELIDHGARQPSDEFWTVDPIDGTKGFLRGDHYAVALAYVEGKQVQVAAMACPKLEDVDDLDKNGNGSVLVAARGEGAWIAPLQKPENEDVDTAYTRLRVSTMDDTRSARVLRSVVAAHTNTSKTDHLVAALATTSPPVSLDSQAKYAVLASGGAEVMVRFLSPRQPDYREKIWDQAAGSLIVEEAGGRATDLDSKPFDFSQGRTLAKNRGVLATNGLLHTTALDAIREIGA